MSSTQTTQQDVAKDPVVTGLQAMEIDGSSQEEDGVNGTRYDVTDMDRMGKAQQFKVSTLMPCDVLG